MGVQDRGETGLTYVREEAWRAVLRALDITAAPNKGDAIELPSGTLHFGKNHGKNGTAETIQANFIMPANLISGYKKGTIYGLTDGKPDLIPGQTDEQTIVGRIKKGLRNLRNLLAQAPDPMMAEIVPGVIVVREKKPNPSQNARPHGSESNQLLLEKWVAESLEKHCPAGLVFKDYTKKGYGYDFAYETPQGVKVHYFDAKSEAVLTSRQSEMVRQAFEEGVQYTIVGRRGHYHVKPSDLVPTGQTTIPGVKI